MTPKRWLRQMVKKIAFGGDTLPQRFFLSQKEPQGEVSVWLHGMGEPVDVTRRHCLGCPLPFTVCLAFGVEDVPGESERQRLSLQFRESDGSQRLLGEIGLRPSETIEKEGGRVFLLFQARYARNYCLSKWRLWTHSLLHAYAQRKSGSDIQLSALERNALAVMFICPRAISLVSVANGERGNIFPVNVMGDLENGYFAFALKEGKLPAKFVQETLQVALSSAPMTEAAIAYRLGANHNRGSIDWYQLPFETRPSAKLGIPVPVFAYRVRELQVETVHGLGSHLFFMARVMSDELLKEGPELCVVHGYYQAWRLEQRGVDRAASLAADAAVRAELAVPVTAR